MDSILEGPTLWYLNRSTGIVIMGLLTLSMLLGMLSTFGREGGNVARRFASQALHRNISLVAVVLLVIHVVTADVDTFVDIRWWQAFSPFGATYEPLWMALGALSLDLIILVVVNQPHPGTHEPPALETHSLDVVRRMVPRGRARMGHRHRHDGPRCMGCQIHSGVRDRRLPGGGRAAGWPITPSRNRGHWRRGMSVSGKSPVPIPEEIRIHPGPALFSDLGQGPTLAAHRGRLGSPAKLTLPQLVAVTERVRLRGRGGSRVPVQQEARGDGRRPRPTLCCGEPQRG